MELVQALRSLLVSPLLAVLIVLFGVVLLLGGPSMQRSFVTALSNAADAYVARKVVRARSAL